MYMYMYSTYTCTCTCSNTRICVLFLLTVPVQEYSGSAVPSFLNRIKSTEQPPTYNKVNKFTRAFQAIVDAYGIATYQEVNPSELNESHSIKQI